MEEGEAEINFRLRLSDGRTLSNYWHETTGIDGAPDRTGHLVHLHSNQLMNQNV